MSGSADCYAVIVARPDRLGLVDKLIPDLEPGHRSAYATETASDS